jgi:hypothetical protein
MLAQLLLEGALVESREQVEQIGNSERGDVS